MLKINMAGTKINRGGGGSKFEATPIVIVTKLYRTFISKLKIIKGIPIGNLASLEVNFKIVFSIY